MCFLLIPFIDINNWFIDINNLFIDINNSIYWYICMRIKFDFNPIYNPAWPLILRHQMLHQPTLHSQLN